MSNSDNGLEVGRGRREGEWTTTSHMQAELGRLEKAKQAACTVVPVALEMKWVYL